MSQPKNVRIPDNVNDAVDRVDGLEQPLWYIGPLADDPSSRTPNGNAPKNGNGNGNGKPSTKGPPAAHPGVPRQVRRTRTTLR